MANFKLGFRNRSASEQVEIGERVARGSAHLPPEKCAPAKRTIQSEAVVAVKARMARIERQESQLRAERSGLKTDLIVLRRTSRMLCNHISGNIDDDAGLLSVGMELEASKTRPVGSPVAPSQLRAEAIDVNDAVRLRWKHPLRRCHFIVQMTTDPTAKDGWQQCDAGFWKHKCEIKKLTPGVKYWFRVRAGNPHGESPWSNLVCVRVK